MIQAVQLSKRFEKVLALDSMSFHIGRGSIFGLVGSNGAGKSTFLRIAAGVYRPDGGELLIEGQPPFDHPEVKGKIFFIPDFPYFPPRATLKSMAAFYARIYPGWDTAYFTKLCELFPLDSGARVFSMSKGMQRQAALICALASRPELLLMDEVFDGLDPVMRQLLKRLVSGEVAERGMSVVIASHNMRELEDFCDHIGLFHKGGVLLERELDDLKLGLSKVQAVFCPMPEPEALSGLNIVKKTVSGSLLSLVARGKQEDVLEVLQAMGPQFLEVLPLTLEEVFISEMEVAGYDIENILQ